MPHYKLTLPYKLHRVEIIRSEDMNFDNAQIYKPFEKITPKGEKISQKELSETELKKKSRTFFFEEKSLPSVSEYLQLDLSKPLMNPVSMQEVQDEIQHAYDRGFDEAQQLTRTTFEIELQKRQHWVLNFDSVFKQMDIQFAQQMRNLEDSVIPLAVMVAEHILEREISSDANIVIEQVRKAIRSIDNENIIKIHLHPYNIEILRKVESSLFSNTSKIENMQIVANDNVDQGSCIIETSAGIIDATIKSQLSKIRQSLENAAQRHFPENLANSQFGGITNND